MRLDKQNLEALMKDFYILTGIKLAVFDNDYREILSYPQGNCPFCSLMQENSQTYELCMKSNKKSFDYCKKSSKLIIYHCHAGLVEATAPLIDNGAIIGYIMMGQITDVENINDRIDSISEISIKYGIKDEYIEQLFHNVSYKSQEQINAAAKILEACTFYVLQKEMIGLEKRSFIDKLNQYIDKNIDENINVDTICSVLDIGRSKLYELSMQYLGMGIAKYIKNKRIKKAMELLKSTDYSISEISTMVGFYDYNYFCRTFKKETTIPANRYRDLHK